MKPTIGRIVLYRSRTGDYTCPAIITATRDTLFQPNVDAGHIPGLDTDNHVHLTVFTPGSPGKRGDAKDFKVVSDMPIAENVGGLYQEWNIAYFAEINDYRAQAPGTWAWPPKI